LSTRELFYNDGPTNPYDTDKGLVKIELNNCTLNGSKISELDYVSTNFRNQLFYFPASIGSYDFAVISGE